MSPFVCGTVHLILLLSDQIDIWPSSDQADIFPPENNGLSFTGYGQEHEPVSVQVPYQPDEARLIGADRKQRGGRIHPYHRHLKWTHCVDVILIHLALHLDLVGTDIVHFL
jgi:hypothetical protein